MKIKNNELLIEEIGEKFKQARMKYTSYIMDDMAKILNVTVPVIVDFEKGKRVTNIYILVGYLKILRNTDAYNELLTSIIDNNDLWADFIQNLKEVNNSKTKLCIIGG